MIKIEVVLGVHKVLIKKYGGANGVRDRRLLESAIKRPYQTFDGKELYETSESKAAAMIESIIKNHPFVDGNKRTGYAMMRLVLMKDEKGIQANQKEKYEFVIKIASSKIDYEEIRDWINEKIEILK